MVNNQAWPQMVDCANERIRGRREFDNQLANKGATPAPREDSRADNIEKVIIQYLHAICADIGSIKEGIREVKRRLATMETGLGS